MIARNPALATGLAVVVLLGGCSPAPAPEFDPAASERLQTKVAAVTESSAVADYAAAVLALDELVAQAKDALARHQISPARYESIIAAVNLVRVDLEAAIASNQPAPAELPAEGQDATSGTNNEGTGTGSGSGGTDTDPGTNDSGDNDAGKVDKGNEGKGNEKGKNDPPAPPKPKDK